MLRRLITDPLGFRSITEQKRSADRFAREMYDPSVYAPQIAETRNLASEGIDDATMRTGVVRNLFNRTPQRMGSAFGGNQAALISGMGAMDASLAGAQAGAELDIAQQEDEVKRTARLSLAELMSQAKQTQNTQDAAMEQNEMFAEAERDRRTGELLGTAVGFGVTAMGGAEGIGAMLGIGGGEATGDKRLPSNKQLLDLQNDIPELDIDESLYNPRIDMDGLDFPDFKQDFFGMADENGGFPLPIEEEPVEDNGFRFFDVPLEEETEDDEELDFAGQGATKGVAGGGSVGTTQNTRVFARTQGRDYSPNNSISPADIGQYIRNLFSRD